VPEVSKSKKNESFLKKRAFIAAYRTTASVHAAGRAAKVRPELHYQWLKSDAVYRLAWETVQDQAAQTLEDEAVRRAREGVKSMRIHQGLPVKHGRKILYDVEYSDQLLLALLKRFRPALYRERTETQVTGSLEIIDRLQAGRKRLLEMKLNDTPVAG